MRVNKTPRGPGRSGVLAISILVLVALAILASTLTGADVFRGKRVIFDDLEHPSLNVSPDEQQSQDRAAARSANLWKIVIQVCLLLVVVGLIFPSVRRTMILGAVYFVLIVVLANVLMHLPQYQRPEVAAEGEAFPQADPNAANYLQDDREEVRVPEPVESGRNPLVIVLGFGLAATAGYGLWRLYRGVERMRRRQRLDETVRETVRSLDTGKHYDQVVLQVWYELEHYAKKNTPYSRRKSSTPREYIQILATGGFKKEDLDVVRGAFEAVRYGGSELPPESLASLRASLIRLVGEDEVRDV